MNNPRVRFEWQQQGEQQKQCQTDGVDHENGDAAKKGADGTDQEEDDRQNKVQMLDEGHQFKLPYIGQNDEHHIGYACADHRPLQWSEQLIFFVIHDEGKGIDQKINLIYTI